MKKNNNKKGFTIVELVIVIAVIAILAAVLIPTFSGVINSANESAALQEAQNAYKEAYADALVNNKGIIKANDTGSTADGKWTFTFTDAQNARGTTTDNTFGYECISVTNGVVKVAKTHTYGESNKCTCGATEAADE